MGKKKDYSHKGPISNIPENPPFSGVGIGGIHETSPSNNDKTRSKHHYDILEKMIKCQTELENISEEEEILHQKLMNELNDNKEFYKNYNQQEINSIKKYVLETNKKYTFFHKTLADSISMMKNPNLHPYLVQMKKEITEFNKIISDQKVYLEKGEQLTNDLILGRKEKQRDVKPTTNSSIPVIENSLDEDLEKLKPTLPKKNKDESDKTSIETNVQLSSEMDVHTCPKCNNITVRFHKDSSKRTESENALVEKFFGWRGSKIQSYCRDCRSSKKTTKEIDPETANEIKKELEELRLQLEKQKKAKMKTTQPKPKPELKPEPKSEIEDIEKIKNLSEKMVKTYLLYKNRINRDLKIKLIRVYLKEKSIKKLYKIYRRDYSKTEIQQHLVTNARLPPELSELESSGSLHQNPKLSIVIALFVTDHFEWDGKNGNEEKISSLAISIAKYLKVNKELDEKFSGKKKINLEIDDKQKRDQLFKKYKYDYSDGYDREKDRTHWQAKALFSHKNIKVVEYTLKYEYKHKARMPESMAADLLKNPEKFFEDLQRNTIRQDKLRRKYGY